MKFIKLDLLTLLIGLFIFASCNSTNNIGLDIDPNEVIEGELIDTITVASRTIRDDVASTDPLIRYPFGFLTDPVFGTSEASVAMTVNLPSDAYSFGSSPVLDSAVLVLTYADQFYGDTINSVYSADVYQLDVDLAAQTSFLSNKEWPAKDTRLGSFTGKLKPRTRVAIDTVLAGRADTAVSVVPQMRIKLNKDFIQQQIVNQSATNLKTNQDFTRFFKGLKINLNKSASTGTGGIAFFNFTGTDSRTGSRLDLYFKRQNATTATTIDTVYTSFPINVSANPVAATIKHNYEGTPVETQLANPNQQYEETYLQGLGGLRNRLSFPYLNAFKEKVGKVVVNKAQIVVDLSTGTDVSPFSAAPRLALYRFDIAGQRKNVPDGDYPSQANPTGQSPLTEQQFGGYFDSINRRYTFVVTRYVQNLLEGSTQDYGTFLGISSATEFNLTPPLSSAARSIIGSFGNQNNKIKLNIYYTKIK